MLALDPPLGIAEDAEPAATIGGVVATGDSGPLRHRYGQPRDLIVGATIALSDGSIAHSGGKVIKNVAGYDLAKLFAGSYGTLGLILSVSVRLHPLHAAEHDRARGGRRRRRAGGGRDRARGGAARVRRARHRLARRAWRSAGAQRRPRARPAGAADRPADDRARPATGRGHSPTTSRCGSASVPVSAPATARWSGSPPGRARWRRFSRATDACDGTLVGRAALGMQLRRGRPRSGRRAASRARPPRAPRPLLDAPAVVRARSTIRGEPPSAAALELMRSVKARFDPAGTCNPGLVRGRDLRWRRSTSSARPSSP